MNCEQRREHLKLKPRYEHLINLSIPRVTIADESLIMLRVVVRGDEEWFVEKL